MMLRRTLSLSLVSLLLSLSLWPAAILAAMTTQVTVETNVAGALVTQTSIWDPATATTTTAAAAAAATTATAKTGSFTTVFTTTNINGATVTLTQTVDRATMLATSSAASSSATAKTTTTGTAVSSSLASGLYLSTVTTTNVVGTTVTLTETFTHSSTAASSSSSGSGSGSSSSGSSTSTGTAAEETGTRPDPSTDFTEPPVTAVTTLSIDTYVTVTEGTTATYTTARAPTSMWVTVVRQGNTITVQTTFVQRFSSQYSAVASPSVGSIGLGSLTGSVGVIKSAMKKTVSHNEAQHLNMNSFTSILGGLLTVLIWFL
ncbi:hypothetical protein SUVZ_14G0130 [Saccharomyces uvarum]|uniref:Kre1p n=1 Tax=Saccharomyces uvarum TaxID=230603 RepID=A0ABN8WQC2_SACUV|nr:hypothetical protein SUVZ_14G0130 [Saccharomyces uvarum]